MALKSRTEQIVFPTESLKKLGRPAAAMDPTDRTDRTDRSDSDSGGRWPAGSWSSNLDQGISRESESGATRGPDPGTPEGAVASGTRPGALITSARPAAARYRCPRSWPPARAARRSHPLATGEAWAAVARWSRCDSRLRAASRPDLGECPGASSGKPRRRSRAAPARAPGPTAPAALICLS